MPVYMSLDDDKELNLVCIYNLVWILDLGFDIHEKLWMYSLINKTKCMY